jgi:hypothetical protein
LVVVSAGGLDASVVESATKEVVLVLPESSVVVTATVVPPVVDSATREVVLVLPESSVVVTATVVPPFALDPTEEDVNSRSSLEGSALDVTEAPEDSAVEEASVNLAEPLRSVVASVVSSADVSLSVAEAALDLEVSSSLTVVLARDV